MRAKRLKIITDNFRIGNNIHFHRETISVAACLFVSSGGVIVSVGKKNISINCHGDYSGIIIVDESQAYAWTINGEKIKMGIGRFSTD